MKLRVLIAMVVVGIGLLQANAQSTFNRRYDSFGQALIQDAWSIEERSDSGYFVVHMSNYQENPGLYLLTAVLALDVEGAVDTVTRVPLTPKSVYCGWANCSDRTNDGGFVIGGTYGNIGDTLRALLIKFDVAGNYEWTRDFLPSGFEWLGRQAKETSDGGYVVCGETSANLGNQNDGFLIKTDANGELEWVQTYNGGGGNDYFVSVDLCGVNDFYLGGERSVSVSNLDFWVQRVNSSGVSVWTRSWGGPFHEPNAHLIATADGHALVASGWATANEEYRLYMAKLDSANGSTIWQRTYGPPLFSNVLFAAKEVAPGGDLIGTGQSYSGGDLSGIMLRTTSAGDSLWLRYYKYYDAVVSNAIGQLRDVLPTPDGGFIAVGVAYNLAIPSGGSYSQDVWVIKTDSFGCIEPGCQLIQGMETQITNLRDALAVAPNPVASGGVVQLHLKLPENFAAQGALRITVVSNDGRVVLEEQLRSATSALIFTAPTSAGLYHVHLSDATRWISGAKLVVE